MRRLTAVLVALAAALMIAVPGMARDVMPNEQAALEQRIAEFESAIRGNDFESMFSVTPPPIIGFIAEQAKVPEAELRAVMAAQMSEMMQSITFESFGMDMASAERGELPDGEPYVMIPTQSVIKIPGTGTMTTNTHTLAFMDGGEWYLVRIEDQNQIDILRRVYPGFADVEFPPSDTSMEVE